MASAESGNLPMPYLASIPVFPHVWHSPLVPLIDVRLVWEVEVRKGILRARLSDTRSADLAPTTLRSPEAFCFHITLLLISSISSSLLSVETPTGAAP